MEMFPGGSVLRNECPGDTFFSLGDAIIFPLSSTRYGKEWISELKYIPLLFDLTLFASRHSERLILTGRGARRTKNRRLTFCLQLLGSVIDRDNGASDNMYDSVFVLLLLTRYSILCHSSYE